MSDYNLLSEDETRYNLINPLLVKAGWNLTDLQPACVEVPIDVCNPSPVNSIVDYFPFRDNCRVLAVIEVPFTNFGLNGVEKLFSEEEVEEILELTNRLIA